MPVRYLSITVTLREDALLATGPRVGNSAVSAPILPGRALRGMLSRVLRRAGAGEELHARLVLSGQLCFTPAYPVTEHGVGLAHPLCLRTDRDTGKLIDLSDPTTAPAAGMRRPPAELTVLGPDGALAGWADVRRVGRGRIQRDRARGRPTETTGGPFHTVPVAAGQAFRAWWRAHGDTPADLDTLLDALLEVQGDTETGVPVTLGRSKDVAHGGDATFTVDDLTERALDLDPVQFAEGEEMWVWLATPALIVDPVTGDYDPAALPAAVQQHLGDAVTLTSSWIAPHLTGGYNATARGYLPEEWAAAAGSVVRCRVTAAGGIDQHTVAGWEHTPLGEQWIDGHGAFLVLPPPTSLTPLTPRSTGQPLPAAGEQVDDGVAERDAAAMLAAAAQRLNYRRLLPRLHASAAAAVRTSGNLPSPSLLSRFREALHIAGDLRDPAVASIALAGAGAVLTTLAAHARDRLRASLITTPKPAENAPVPLRTWLSRILTTPAALFATREPVPHPDTASWRIDITDWEADLPAALLPENTTGAHWLLNHAPSITALYLDEWVRQALLRAKETS